MPEYSSTTITPADGVKTPAMNGSTSGNYTLSALRDFILASKGQANGLASLDANGKLPSSQLPDLADDVIVVASYSTLPATGTAGKLYITADNNKMYRWDPDLTTPDYVELSVDLSAYATIADLQDGTLEPLISTKAKQDQNGNVIDTTYATKAELAAEESARESEDSNLKSAIDALDARVSNIEQGENKEILVNYPDDTQAGHSAWMPDLVPPDVADYVEVKTLRGKTRAWNMRTDIVTGTGTYGGSCVVTRTKSTGTIQIVSDGNNSSSDGLPIIGSNSGAFATTVYEGHKYLFCTNASSAITGLQQKIYVSKDTTWTNATYITQGIAINYILIATIPSGGYKNLTWYGSISANVTCDVTLYPVLRDLTLIFGAGNEPATVADAVKLCPDILKLDAVGYSLVSTTVSGVETTSKNLLDYSTVSHPSATIVLNDDGSITVSATYGAVVIGKDLTKTIESGTYTFSNIAGLQAYVQIGSSSDYSHLVNVGSSYTFNYDGTTYLRILCNNQSSGSTVTYKAQIERGSSATSYSKFGVMDTLTLPSPSTGHSAGSVADTDELNVEVLIDGVRVNKRRQTKRIDRSIINGTTTWSYTHDQGSFAWFESTNFTGAKPSGAIISSRFKYGALSTDEGLQLLSNGQIRLSILKSRLSEVSTNGLVAYFTSNPLDVNYELEEESVTLLDPIEDNFIKVEPNGTVRTIQTQMTDTPPKPEIDNCLDAEYYNIGA